MNEKMTQLTKKSENGATWYPISIDKLDSLLIKVIHQSKGTGFIHVYALRKNISYNLQYLEFIDRYLSDLKLSTVIITQTYKMFILVGCSIVESLLDYLLIKSGHHAKTIWKLDLIAHGNEKPFNDKRIKVDSHIYTRLSTPKWEEMTFDAMIKKAEKKKILGSSNPNIYPRLKHLRKLRNKVHLQSIDEPTDTDWNSFPPSELHAMAEVIHLIFTGSLFRPSKEERAYFSYLEKYLEIQTAV